MVAIERTVRRKVVSSRGDPLVVALTPEGIWLREPHRRKAYLLPYGMAFQRAVALSVDADRREKKAARAAKRKVS